MGQLVPSQILHFTCNRWIPYAGLLGAVNALKQNLQELGSDLVVLHGPMESVLPDLANSLQASNIILEEEIEYRCAAAMAQLAHGPTADSLSLYLF